MLKSNITLISTHEGAECLKQGKVIAYPTEAVYGLGCDPDNKQALDNLLKIKERSANKGLILIADNIERLENYIDFTEVDINMLDNIKQSWPGFTTWLVPINKNNLQSINAILYGQFSTIAVRVTNHPVVIELCQLFGKPIVSTSANISGNNAITSIEELTTNFDDKIAGIVEGELGGQSKPSNIIDSLSGKIIR